MRSLMTACAVAALLTAGAKAQAVGDAAPDAREPVYLEAGVLIDDRDNQRLFARENVRMQSGERTLFADEIEYNPQTGRVIARGNVRLFQGDEPATLAESIELDSEMSEGVAYGFATLLENDGKAAASVAVRRADGSVEMTRGYYTACDLCEDGSGSPTWRLRASRVTRDLDDQMIYYRNVRLEILGAPILYAPIFAHADPSTPRRSGFLIPSVDFSNRLGFSYKQPYLWVISPHSDLVVAPRYMSEVNPSLELQYRRRFYSGEFAFSGSATYEQEFDEDGFFGAEELRWHTFAEGRFNFTPRWRWGFGVQATSGDLYLRRYDFSESPDIGRGIYEMPNRNLASQIYLQGQGQNYYSDIAAIRVTSLFEGQNDDALPHIAPIGQLLTDLPFPDWAGLLESELSTANLVREDGDDYLRASAGLRWNRSTILPLGVRFEPYAIGRIDAYAVTETDGAGVETGSRNFTRALGAVGTDISWPFARIDSWGQTIIAPRVHLVSATGVDDGERPPNEDSQIVDIDSVSLFSRNRAGGYDLWENGQRADVGMLLELDTVSEWLPDAEVFAGRSYRLDNEVPFGAGTGLDNENSDWVAEFGIDLAGFSIDSRNRFDSESGRLNRSDVRGTFSAWRVGSALRYTKLTAEAPGQNDDEEIAASVSFELTDRWSVGAAARRDLDTDETRTAQASLSYEDECTRLDIIYERENYNIGNLGPRTSVRFQLTLFTLGALQDD